MHRSTQKTFKYFLTGLILVGLSACGSGSNDDAANDGVDESADSTASPSANPFDPPEQPVDQTPAEDDTQVENESPEDTQMPVGSNSDTSTIAGLWDLTQIVAEGNDAVQVLIGQSGELTEFDFQGDNTGDGRDCYLVKNLQIVSRGSDQYDIQNDSVLPGSQGSEDVMITVEDGSIVFRFFALIPAPEGGNELSPQSIQFPASDLNADELTACE